LHHRFSFLHTFPVAVSIRTPKKIGRTRVGQGPAFWALEREMIEAILGHGLAEITDEVLAYAPPMSERISQFAFREQPAEGHNYIET
jgi:hypothetical protein